MFSDLSKSSGLVTLAVNLTNAPEIQGFAVSLTYNTHVLSATTGGGIVFTGNVLESIPGNSISPLRNCVDGKGALGKCQSSDGPGVVSLALLNFGPGTTSSPTNGLLFKVTFNIVGRGLSQIHLREVALSKGLQGAQGIIPVSVFDGYFNNLDCPTGSRLLCKPPLVDFTISPSLPAPSGVTTFNASALRGKDLTFNASASKAVNLGPPRATIRNFTWVFGDTCNTCGSQSTNGTTVTITHVYELPGNFTVALIVTDTYGITWTKEVVLNVIAILIDLSVSDLTADQSGGVVPGTKVTITAKAFNGGTSKENASMEINLEGRVLKNVSFTNMMPGQEDKTIVVWDTSNYVPRVYRVDAIIPPVRNATTGQIIENNIFNNRKSTWIQLVTPIPSGLRLSLLPATGLSVLVLAGLVFMASRLRKPARDGELP